MIALKHKLSDPGFCREYYTYSYNGNKKLCCIQQSGKNTFELLACTPDGEPDCRLKLSLFQIPKEYEGKIIHD